MRAIRDIDFLNDEETRRRLLRWSYALLAVAAAGGVALGLAGAFDPWGEGGRLGEAIGANGIGGAILWLLAIVLLTFVVLPVHELIHAALFLLFGDRGVHVRFGYESGMLYASSPGLVLSRPRFCVVLAGPAVALSVSLLAIPAVLGLPLVGYVVFALHLSGCAGDLLAIAEALGESACTHVEDTDSGVRLLSAEG